MTKQEVIEIVREKSNKYINEYIRESETTGSTPSVEDAIKEIDSHIFTWINEAISGSGLSAADITDIRNKTRGYGTQKMALAYKESMNRQPRKKDGVQPQVKSEIEEDVDTPIEKGKSYMKTALEDYIKSNIEFASFPNEKQVGSFLDETIDEAIQYYATDLSDNSKTYIRGQLKKYKEVLLRTVYKPQSKAVSVSRSQGSTQSGSSGGSTTQPTQQQQGPPKVFADKIPVAAGVSEWAKTNISFSGCDMVVSAEMKTTDGTRVSVTIGSLQTLSYSVYRQLSAVKNIGNINAKDYVGGPRTIAGSMVFTVLNQHWGAELLTKFSEAEGYKHSRKILMDEIAPVNLTVSMANEYGIYARLAIYGVRFFSEGQVMSINDIYTENTFQYVALNIDYMVDIGSNANTNKSGSNRITSPVPTPVNTVPVNDGGRKTETSTEQPATKPKVDGNSGKILGPDGEIMDLTKFETRAIAIAWANEKKMAADDKIVSIANGDKNKIKELKELNQRRYGEAMIAINKYYDSLEKSIPEEVSEK